MPFPSNLQGFRRLSCLCLGDPFFTKKRRGKRDDSTPMNLEEKQTITVREVLEGEERDVYRRKVDQEP